MRIFLAVAFLLFVPLASASDSAIEKSDETAIKQLILDMWSAVSKGDVEGYLEHVHPDYTLFGEGDIYLQSGKSMERQSYTDYLSRAKNVRTFMHQPQFHIRGDTAWVTYYWSDSGYMKGERFTSQGKSTRIFVKENGRWLCIHGHFTSVE